MPDQAAVRFLAFDQKTQRRRDAETVRRQRRIILRFPPAFSATLCLCVSALKQSALLRRGPIVIGFAENCLVDLSSYVIRRFGRFFLGLARELDLLIPAHIYRVAAPL